MKKGQRVEHTDTSYACYGTVVSDERDGWVDVLWDAVDGPPDADPHAHESSPEPVDALKVIA